MNNTKKVICFILLLYCLPGIAKTSKNEGWSMSQASVNHVFTVKLFCKEAPQIGSFQQCWLDVLGLRQQILGKKLKGLNIALSGGMPAHHHGLPTEPVVKWSAENETYLIEGLKFSMPGKWQLQFYINDPVNMLKDIATLKVNL